MSAALCAVALLGLSAGTCGGGEARASPGNGTAVETGSERTRREGELKAAREALGTSVETQRRIEQEIAAIEADRSRLSAALMEGARRIRAAEARIQAVEQRLEATMGSEAAIRRSLEARRSVLAEILAALQRMGRRPPPAVLVRPEDLLQAIRTSMLLAAVLPELRAEAETLAADLAELVRLRQAIAADRDALQGEAKTLGLEQERVAALMVARQRRLAEAETTIDAERVRAAELAARARTLGDLLDGMERAQSAARSGADEERSAQDAKARRTRERFAAAAVRDPARLAPKLPFAEARGLLPMPTGGKMVRGFGDPDGSGGATRGISISTRPRAVVSSPSDGWVAFAGPFRSFGRLLIINAGGGYYLLLAGMDQIGVEVGQFVLAGEPVATMGERSSALPGAGAVENDRPVLYVEFRKDGGSIDPGPWWSKSQGEKVRG